MYLSGGLRCGLVLVRSFFRGCHGGVRSGVLGGCPGGGGPSPETAATGLRVAGLKGPTTMGLVNLMESDDGANYTFTMYGAADEFVSKLVKGELDAAAVPANLAATLYQKTQGQVEVACVNTLGVLYIVGKRRYRPVGGGPEGPDHRHHR